jgi:hypothetical protein
MFLHRKSSLENKTTICDNPILVSRFYTFCMCLQCIMYCLFMYWSGADPGFQVRGAYLKKLGVFRVKKRFYANKSYSYQLRREARNILGYFVWKITILRQQIIFFTILGGGRPCWLCLFYVCFVLSFYVLIMSVLCMLCVEMKMLMILCWNLFDELCHISFLLHVLCIYFTYNVCI